MPNSHNILFFFCENVLPSNVRMFLFIPKVNYTEYSILIGFPRCLVVAMINVDFDLAKLEKPPWKGLWWTATLTKCFSRAGCRAGRQGEAFWICSTGTSTLERWTSKLSDSGQDYSPWKSIKVSGKTMLLHYSTCPSSGGLPIWNRGWGKGGGSRLTKTIF